MLKKYYFRAAILPSIIALICNIVGFVLGESLSNYKIEWTTTGSTFLIIILISIGMSVIFCLLSLPIFLNSYDGIKRRVITSALTWFLAPVVWIVFLVTETGDAFEFSHGMDSEGILFLINTLPYLIALVISYWQFRKELRHVPILEV